MCVLLHTICARRMDNPTKRVLLTSNGDAISMNIALNLAKRGCRLISLLSEAKNSICSCFIDDHLRD